jgi:subfamily B ATP-binding cassette protein MsbA
MNNVAHPPVLEVRGLSKRFDEGGLSVSVLQGVDLTVQAGETVAIVGASGSGKSTLINLLMRFYDPTKGKILLDGHDLKEYATKDLLAQMALVSQDVVLFNLPVATNIGFGHEGASQADIEQAAKRAYAHDFIMKMPSGYDSPCGERGQFLSGGQKARVAIARAFVRNAPILVLDEPTEGIQPSIIKDIGRVIKRLAARGDMAILLCEQYYDFAEELADQYLVMERGEVIASGPGSEMKDKGIRKLVSI